MKTCEWPLENKQTLTFGVYDPNAQWNKVAGLYIFAYFEQNFWRSLYIGQADDFSVRMPPNHERWEEAVRCGATHIHALTVPQAADRDAWEKALIQHLQPPMNKQLR